MTLSSGSGASADNRVGQRERRYVGVCRCGIAIPAVLSTSSAQVRLTPFYLNMSTTTPYRSNDPFSSSSAKPPPSSSLSSLLAQANSLNHVGRDSELPQIRFGIDEIERMSGVVGGKGKRKGDRGEGWVVFLSCS